MCRCIGHSPVPLNNEQRFKFAMSTYTRAASLCDQRWTCVLWNQGVKWSLCGQASRQPAPAVGMNSLQWRHNDHDCVSNHQPRGCLLNRFFRRRSKKTSKLRVTGLCVGNSPGTGEFPAQRASYAENVSIWWRHHVKPTNQRKPTDQPTNQPKKTNN